MLILDSELLETNFVYVAHNCEHVLLSDLLADVTLFIAYKLLNIHGGWEDWDQTQVIHNEFCQVLLIGRSNNVFFKDFLLCPEC